MTSSVFCSCVVIGSIVYFLSAYTTSFLEDISSVQPIIITTNKRTRDRSISKSNEAEKSPLFKSLKTRYNQLFPQSISINQQLSDGTYINGYDYSQILQNEEQEKDYWNLMGSLIRNRTLNQMFEINEESQQDYLYMLNINNDLYSNITYNPYFGEISVMRVQQKQYLKMKEQSTIRKDSSKQIREEQVFADAQYQNPKMIQICFQSYVPGVVTQIAFNQEKKDRLAVVYRILTDKGQIYRIRIFNNIICNDEMQYSSTRTNQGSYQLHKTLEDEQLYANPYNDETITDALFEDFPIRGQFIVTALNFNNGDTITYSRDMDYYQYRIMQRGFDINGKVVWKQIQRGPIIDRRIDKIFLCTGLHYLDMGTKIPYLIVVALKGANHYEAKLSVEFQILNTNLSTPEWQTKKRIYEKLFPIHQAPNMFNGEVIAYYTAFTDQNSRNKIVSLFGSYFLALDWSEEANNIQVFSTFKDNADRIDLLSVLPDNSNIILYSIELHQMTHVLRDKADPEQVMEDWTDIRLNQLPVEIQDKRILSIYFKQVNKENILMVLFEGGILASMKIDINRDDYTQSLLDLDGEFYYDILIPIFFAAVATISIYLKRRMNSQQLNNERDINRNQPIPNVFNNIQNINQQRRFNGFNQLNMPQQPPSPSRLENLNPLQGDANENPIDDVIQQQQQEQNQQQQEVEDLINQENQQEIEEENDDQQELEADLISLEEEDFNNIAEEQQMADEEFYNNQDQQ